MSVILESQSGDELFCVESFSASLEGEAFSWESSRTFRVGERISYIESGVHPQFPGRPNGWMVRFRAKDGKRYAATQTYFVTGETWRGLKRCFATRLMREPGRRRGPRLPSP